MLIKSLPQYKPNPTLTLSTLIDMCHCDSNKYENEKKKKNG